MNKLVKNPCRDIANPYWEEVKNFPNSDLRWNKDRFEPDPYPYLMERLADPKSLIENPPRTRSDLVRQYAWAIPSDETIEWLGERFKGQTFVEIGAGRGYWASLLAQVGILVYAYDMAPPNIESNHYFNKIEIENGAGDDTVFYPVVKGGIESLTFHQSAVLFLCWPPYDDDFAAHTLRYYEGNTFVFVGEGHGGCTGNDEFFEELHKNWQEVEDCSHFVSWSGIHDHLTIYKRTPVLTEEP